MSQREMQIHIQKLEQDNYSKDMAIDKAAKIIETLHYDLERTRNELEKSETYLFKQKPKSSQSEREKKLLHQVEDLNQHCTSLQQQLIEISQQFKIKESAFQNAMIALEQKEIIIDQLQQSIQRVNSDCEQEKENVQKEIDFVKRLTENFYRSDIKPSNLDISQIIKNRPGHSPDNSSVLTDASNIYFNRNKIRQSRKHTAKAKTQDLSSFYQEADLDQNSLQQNISIKYINYASNDFDWEQTIYCFSSMKKRDIQKLCEKMCKRQYLQDIRCQIEQWQMRSSELEMRNYEAIQKAEVLSQLLRDMQFSFEFLKRNKNNLIIAVYQCLKKIVQNCELTNNEIENFVREVEVGYCPQVLNLGEFNLVQFHELIMIFKQQMQRRQEQQIFRQQNDDRRDQERQNLEGHLDNLALLLNTYKDLHHELLDKIINPINAKQIRDYSPQSLQILQKQAMLKLDENQILYSGYTDLREQLNLSNEKNRLIELELQEAQNQNQILHDQLIKEETEVRQLQHKIEDSYQINQKLEEDNIKFREDFINSQLQRQSYQYDQIEQSQFQSDLNQITDVHKQTMSLLNNALHELEELQIENERLCDRIDELSSVEVKKQDSDEEYSEMQHRVMIEEKDLMLKIYQQKFSKTSSVSSNEYVAQIMPQNENMKDLQDKSIDLSQESGRPARSRGKIQRNRALR